MKAKLQFSNLAFPKSTNLGELVLVNMLFWQEALFLFSTCCGDFVINAVEDATGPPKFQRTVSVVVAFAFHNKLSHSPHFYGPILA